MAPKKKAPAKKILGKKDMKKTQGGIVVNWTSSTRISDGTSNTVLPAVQNQACDGSV